MRVKIGIGKLYEGKFIPKLVVSPKRRLWRGETCSCGGRLWLKGIYTCSLCFFRGKRLLVFTCVKCGKRQEVLSLPKGGFLVDERERGDKEVRQEN